MRKQDWRDVGSQSNEAATAENKGSDVTNAIDDIIKLESLEKTASERIAEKIAAFTGSMFFIWLHVVWFGLWIVFNIPWLGSNDGRVVGGDLSFGVHSYVGKQAGPIGRPQIDRSI